MKRGYGPILVLSIVFLFLSGAGPARGKAPGQLPSVTGEEDIWTPVATLSGGTTAFGWSVDVGGDIAVVGDHNSGQDGEPQAGAVYVYERDESDDSWMQVKVLKAPTPQVCSFFGKAVVVNEAADTIIVGEPGSRHHPACKQDGSIYIFGRDEGGPGNWGLIQTIEGTGHYGAPLALEGDTLAVGIPGDLSGGLTCGNGIVARPDDLAGSVQVFRRDQGGPDNWGMIIEIGAPWDDDHDRYFGCSVAISGNRLAVGAPDYGEMGMVFLYDGNEGWALVDSYDGFQRWNTFGFEVALSEEDFFIGAPFEHRGTGNDFVGQIYPAGSSTPLPYPQIDHTGDWAYIVGTSMAVDDGVLVATYDATNATEVYHDVLVYRDNAAGWELVQVLEGFAPDSCWTNMGLAIDGDTLIVGQSCGGLAHILERSFPTNPSLLYLPTVVR